MYTSTVSPSSKVIASYLESVIVRMRNAPIDLDLVLSSVKQVVTGLCIVRVFCGQVGA